MLLEWARFMHKVLGGSPAWLEHEPRCVRWVGIFFFREGGLRPGAYRLDRIIFGVNKAISGLEPGCQFLEGISREPFYLSTTNF